MPHCILEHSSNIKEQINTHSFFQNIHQILIENGKYTANSTNTGPGNIELSRIKSRAICHEDYYVGDGNIQNAFIYLQISILSGRPIAVRQNIGKHALEFMKEYFKQSIHQLTCSVTVEVREIESETHFK